MKMIISACAADNGKSGIGHYIQHTVPGLINQLSPNSVEVYVESDNDFLDHLNDERTRIIALPKIFSGAIGNLFWHLVLLPLITLFHKPSTTVFLAANRRLAPVLHGTSIGVVHDLSQLHIKGKYDQFRTFYVLKFLPVLMRKLDKIVSVSHSTAKDLINHVGIPKHRIQVVHNGAEIDRFTIKKQKAPLNSEFGIKKPYLLYTARLEHPGKNHVRLLEAFSLLKKRHDIQMVFAGAPWNGAEAIYEKVEELKLKDDVIITGFVDSSDLPGLLQHAEIFVFPSLFEGFGIPLLEAMAAGTPICAANVSSLPEVIDSCGLLFNPTDAGDMAQVIDEILSIPSLGKSLAIKATHRASTFTWARSSSNLATEIRRTVFHRELCRMENSRMLH